MAVNIGNAAQAGLLSQQYPPPLLPKPGKENVRLQKLLKKTAKKKAASQSSQTPVPFRSSLSPVNEASPDLEHSDHSTPPKTPETPIYGGTLHPRFNVRPLYQHIASPYPHQRSISYGKPARFSPQPFVPPGLSPPHHMAPMFTYTAPPQTVPLVTVTSVAAITTTTEFVRHADIKPGAPVKQINSVVLTTQLEANSSLTPTFTTSKPSKPMFDVPLITNYTSKTTSLRTYYTASPTLERSKTPLAEIKRSQTPTFEVRRIVTPTSELKRERTPTREIRRGTTPTSEIKRGATPTFEIKRGPTPTSEIRRGPTPTAEIKRGLTPTSEIKRGPTPTPEMKKVPTTTLEVKRGTTPTSEIRGDAAVKTETTRGRTPTRERTPTFELSTTKTLTGRPKTPSYHVSPARTPVIEISRPNPLLFAVSPVHMEGRRSKTPTSSLLGPSDETPKETDKPKDSNKIPEAIQNGDVQMKPSEISADKKSSENIREPELPKIPAQDAPKFTETSEPQSQTAPLHESSKPVPTAEIPSSKPPNYEFDKPVVPSPGLQRPRIPPFAGQRPRTPTSKSSKSTYYGLTPAEYVAHGGIQSFTPAFGFSRSISPTTVVSKPPEPESQEPTQNTQGKAKEQSTLKEAARPEAVPKEPETPVSKVPPSTNSEPTAVSEAAPMSAVQKILKSVEEAPKLPTPEVKKTEEKVSAITIPTIVVSKADTPPAEVPQAVTTVPVTTRVRTPTYGPPKPKTPPSDSKVEPTKPETKPTSASDQTANIAKTSKPTPAKDAVTAKTDKVSKKPSAPQKSLLERIKEQKSLTAVASDTAATEKTQDKPLVKPTDDQKDKVKPEKKDLAEAKESTLQETKPAVEEKGDNSSLPTAEPLLKAFQKPKGMKSKLSGWSRLKKHMVVEVEEPTFPEAETALKKEAPDGTAQKPSEQKPQGKEADKISEEPTGKSQEDTDSPRAAKMWDAVLFQMFSTKESIMQQIEASKTDEQKKEESKLDKPKEIPSFAHRLPVLLYSPRFDARKLREAASRPVTKIATVFEMGLIGRKGKDEEPKDFNRTAKGFAAKSTDV